MAEEAPTGPVRPDLEDQGAEVQPTPVLTLDDYCAEHGLTKVDFIRMDIEGAEQRALEGAQGVIDRDKPHVLLEIHPKMLASRFGGSADAVVDVFRSRGYRMFALNGDRLEERTDVVPDLDWKDYFFVHPSRAARLPDGVSRIVWPIARGSARDFSSYQTTRAKYFSPSRTVDTGRPL